MQKRASKNFRSHQWGAERECLACADSEDPLRHERNDEQRLKNAQKREQGPSSVLAEFTSTSVMIIMQNG